MCNDSARQAGAEEGVTEIVVTPEMIEAGFKILQDSGLTDDLLEADKCTVAEIFRAMSQFDPCRQASRE